MGYNAGADVGFKLSKNVGVGGLIRYSHATLTFPLTGSANGIDGEPRHGQYVEAGSLFSQAGVDLKRADEAVSTIVAELGRIVSERVPEDELTKARNMLKGRLVLGLEDPRSITSFGLRGTILEGEPREIPEILAGFDAVTADDVSRVANDLLAPEKLRLAAIGPFEDESHFEALLN